MGRQRILVVEEVSAASGAVARGMIDFGAEWFVQTLAFARAAHVGQVDKAGRPYVEHVERVARRLVQLFPDATREQVQAALLHDVIEDTTTTLHDVRVLFGTHVAAIVAALTKPPGRVYADYIADLVASGNVDALRVKLADNLENSDPNRPHPNQGRMIRERYAPARALLELALAQA